MAGDPEVWLKHFRNLEEQLSRSILDAWPVCVAPLQNKADLMTHEDHITKHLVNTLRRRKTVPGRVNYQYALLVEDGNGNVSLSGNIDIVLTIGDDEDVYLACECKRLYALTNTRVRALASEYILEGLLRFTGEQYSRYLPQAMMLGYVMNAQTQRAREVIKKAMHARRDLVGLQEERDTNAASETTIRFVTTHRRQASLPIEVVHTLLAWPTMTSDLKG